LAENKFEAQTSASARRVMSIASFPAYCPQSQIAQQPNITSCHRTANRSGCAIYQGNLICKMQKQ